MAKDAANDLSYFLLIDAQYLSDLGHISPWKNLKVAFEGSQIWVRDFDYAQIHSVEVKTMPYKTLFYSQGGKLLRLNSLLPDRNVPGVLWTPIERALPVRLPALNHNYFGLDERLSIQLVPSEHEAAAVAMITTLETLRTYIITAPAIRLQQLQWTILGTDRVLLLGQPVLPVAGAVFWSRSGFLLPAGYDFDLYLLAETLLQKLDPDHTQWLVWNTDNTYFPVEKSDLQPLSLGSFRAGLRQLSLFESR
jgi:hypothetical protein